VGKQSVAHLAKGYHVKALVVDDVAENRDVLQKLLVDIGVEVQLAENGQDAVQRVRQALPDIVFMDIRMPVMGGLEAARLLWEEYGKEELKIVAVSASTLAHQQEKYLQEGFDAFIAKPFRTELVYDCLATLLRVEYEYASEGERSTLPGDFSEISLAADLRERLIEAADLYRFTELNQYLDEVAGLGPEGQRLAEHLRGFVKNYDMDTVKDILGEIAHE